MQYSIVQITNPKEKETISREVLEALPEWFGIPSATEEYISKSASQPFWCAYVDGITAGFLYLYETGKATLELYVTGVKKQYHRTGNGSALFQAAYEYAKAHGYSFLQVKTVQMGHYEEYDKTNLFYQSLGFQEFEVFPTLWDKQNPCQVDVMAIQ